MLSDCVTNRGAGSFFKQWGTWSVDGEKRSKKSNGRCLEGRTSNVRLSYKETAGIRMNSKQKLELTWIGKENRPKLEPRILLENAGTPAIQETQGDGQGHFRQSANFQDNLLALKALEAGTHRQRLSACTLTPPFNTPASFEHYDDSLEHSIWLSLMRDRLEIIRSLLREDGSLWITIDDNESHYLDGSVR